MTKYKLQYFDGKGRAELSRLIFAAAGQQYEDVRIERGHWPTLKASLVTGQLPVLEVHENNQVYKFSQSLAIARFLAKRFKLAGATELEQADVDMYVDQINDLFNEMIKAYFEVDEIKQAQLMIKLQNEQAPHNFKIFEAKIFETKLSETNTHYLIGKSLTWADLYLVHIVETLISNDVIKQSLENYPELKKHYETVRTLPNIDKWLKSRPVTET